MSIKNLYALSCIATTLLLTGCGSGTTDQVLDSITPPALEDGPGGRFYGYYQQSTQVANPKSDIGGLYLSLPNSGGDFSGRMSFQFLACQRTNAFAISGQKVLPNLKLGIITGNLDSISLDNLNPVFSGMFSGGYSRNGDNYKGTYNRNLTAGDDLKTTDCGTYTVADKGSWQVYKETNVFPATFNVTQTTGLIHWTPVANATKALIMIVSPNNVGTSNNGFVKQMIINAAPATTLPLSIAAPADIGRGSYLTVVELFDKNNQLVAFKTQPMIL